MRGHRPDRPTWADRISWPLPILRSSLAAADLGGPVAVCSSLRRPSSASRNSARNRARPWALILLIRAPRSSRRPFNCQCLRWHALQVTKFPWPRHLAHRCISLPSRCWRCTETESELAGRRFRPSALRIWALIRLRVLNSTLQSGEQLSPSTIFRANVRGVERLRLWASYTNC